MLPYFLNASKCAHLFFTKYSVSGGGVGVGVNTGSFLERVIYSLLSLSISNISFVNIIKNNRGGIGNKKRGGGRGFATFDDARNRSVKNKQKHF